MVNNWYSLANRYTCRRLHAVELDKSFEPGSAMTKANSYQHSGTQARLTRSIQWRPAAFLAEIIYLVCELLCWSIMSFWMTRSTNIFLHLSFRFEINTHFLKRQSGLLRRLLTTGNLKHRRRDIRECGIVTWWLLTTGVLSMIALVNCIQESYWKEILNIKQVNCYYVHTFVYLTPSASHNVQHGMDCRKRKKTVSSSIYFLTSSTCEFISQSV